MGPRGPVSACAAARFEPDPGRRRRSGWAGPCLPPARRPRTAPSRPAPPPGPAAPPSRRRGRRRPGLWPARSRRWRRSPRPPVRHAQCSFQTSAVLWMWAGLRRPWGGKPLRRFQQQGVHEGPAARLPRTCRCRMSYSSVRQAQEGRHAAPVALEPADRLDLPAVLVQGQRHGEAAQAGRRPRPPPGGRSSGAGYRYMYPSLDSFGSCRLQGGQGRADPRVVFRPAQGRK